MFPFNYYGDMVSECITNDGMKWCATTADFDADGKWGNCVYGKHISYKLFHRSKRGEALCPRSLLIRPTKMDPEKTKMPLF